MDEPGFVVNLAHRESFGEWLPDMSRGGDDFIDVEGFSVGHFIDSFLYIIYPLYLIREMNDLWWD